MSADQVSLENMSTVELTMWLQSKGFGANVQTAFEEEEMDGEALSTAFATCSGPDCIKDVIKTYGTRLKVYNVIKTAIGETFQQNVQDQSSPTLSSPPSFNRQESHSTSFSNTPTFTRQQSVSCDGDDTTIYPSSGSSVTSTPLPKKLPAVPRKLNIKGPPDPFPIPMFKQDVEESLGRKKLIDDDRKYMCRVLATVLQTHVQRPSVLHCEIVGKALVRKFPFLKEFHSWTNFIYTRCQNINRKSKNPQSDQDEGSRASKKSKIAPEKHSYPSLTMDEDDDVAFERNVSLMKHELGKQKPQSASIFSLMERTFTRRRQCMLDDCKSVKEICEKYPCLSKSIYIACEFSLVMQSENLEKQFESMWEKYIVAITTYANASRNKSQDLKQALRDDECVSSTAMRCLAHFFSTRRRKKLVDTIDAVDVPFLIVEVSRGTPVQEAVDAANNHPHIVKFVDATGDISPQFFIAIEQQLLLECKSLERAIFIMLAAHYVFNIEYNPKVKDVFLFLEEKVFGFSISVKKSAIYLSASSSIDLYLEE